MEGKNKMFTGEGDVKEFITKVELNSALKGYTDEKCAQNLAARLEGPAFDVYLQWRRNRGGRGGTGPPPHFFAMQYQMKTT